MTPEDIIAAARECLETPFRHQARVVGVGLDCAGVICHVASRLGLPHDTPHDYPRNPYQGQLEQTLDAQPCLRLLSDVGEMQPGDVLLMRFGRAPRHLGVWTGETLIHAYEPAGKCCEHRLDDAWLARVVRVYRFTEMA